MSRIFVIETSMYDDIRPYRDDEVKAVLERVIKDDEFINSVSHFVFPKGMKMFGPLFKKITQWSISWKVRNVYKVKDLQVEVEKYLHKLIKRSTSGFTYSGIENLDLSKPCLFISNHRDITLDPALVNLALHKNGVDTVEIAIGDNLLTRPWVSDLMRLNKSFIVKRSEPNKRAMLAAAKNLSAYIHHTMTENHQHVWIAQREGRAKDGIDKTNAAVISMILLNKPKEVSVTEYVKQLNIVPVAISYEFDPCDQDKAKELAEIEQNGSYKKAENEDIRSITQGLIGEKGQVHVAFGQPLHGEFSDSKVIAEQIDRQIARDYKLYQSNQKAAEFLQNEAFDTTKLLTADNPLLERVSLLNEAQAAYVVNMYANPVFAKDKW